MSSTAEWRAGGAFFEYKDHRIFWHEGGDPGAPTLLLMHGYPTASWDWHKLWPQLTERYHVIALDMIGFGFSDKPYSYDYRIMDQADIYDAFLRLRAVKQYHALAHDIGVSVAAELIARGAEDTARPQLLSACLVNGTLFPETYRLVFLQSLLLSRLGPIVSLLTTKSGLAASMRTLFGKCFPPDGETLDGMWALIKNNHGARILYRLIHYIPDRIEHRERWVSAVQRTSVPIKLIAGMLDPVSGARMVSRYRELIPNANVTELDQGGHYPHIHVPEQVLGAYLAFRQELEPSVTARSGTRPVATRLN